MNAIIMAAGMSSRFIPLSWECPKGLLEVKGEILIERQIRQLKDAGVKDITIVTGYMSNKFDYLSDKYSVDLVYNPDYERYNNTSTLMCVLDRLADTWICSSDNYFTENIFNVRPLCSQYSAVYCEGETSEYCLSLDPNDNIIGVEIGGADAWYMLGPVFFSAEFSRAFKLLLCKEYIKEEVKQGYWEDVYLKKIDELPLMRIRRFESGIINEFDTLTELRDFDESYIYDTRSQIIKDICNKFHCLEEEIKNIRKEDAEHFSFTLNDEMYLYKKTL